MKDSYQNITFATLIDRRKIEETLCRQRHFHMNYKGWDNLKPAFLSLSKDRKVRKFLKKEVRVILLKQFIMLTTVKNPSVGYVPTTNKVNEQPRDSYSFVNRLANDASFYNEFKVNPLRTFGEYGFDTSKIFIPSDFIMPSQALLRDRLQIIYSYEDFVSPAEMSTLPILPVIFIFIPIFAS